MDEYLLRDLADNIGQTVTIFTTSGGESGRGFTGVLTTVNPGFVRLVISVGQAPGCALGNCCDEHPRRNGEGTEIGGQGRFNCRNGNFGSIVDIPVFRIAAFVHNAVGSSDY